MSRLRELLGRQRVQHLLVVALSAALLLPNVGMGLYDPWETHYAETARRMDVQGDWITLRWHADSRLADDVNGRCRADPEQCFFFSKPAFIFWLMGLSYRLFGVGDAAARLPLILVGIAGIFGAYWYTRRMMGLGTGLLAAAVLATTPYYYLLSRQIMTDIAFVVPLMVGLLAVAYWLTAPDEARPRHLYLSYALAGVATLAKGLMGFLVPAAIVLAYLVLRPSALGAQLRRLQPGRGALIVAAVAGPWYAAVYAINGSTWFREFIVKHHFARVGEGVHGERGTFEYFIEQLGYGLWPWVLLVPLALGAAWVGARREARASAGLHTFLIVWAAAAFGFFTISTTKFHHYVFPAVPAIALLVAITLGRMLGEGGARPAEKALLALGAGLLAAVTPVVLAQPFRFINLFIYKYDRNYPEIEHSAAVLGLAAGVFALGAALLFAPLGRRLRAAAPALLCAGALGAAGWNIHGVVKGYEHFLSQRDAWDAYGRLRRPGDRLYEWANRWRGEVWYSRDTSHEIPQQATVRLRRELGRPGRAFIITTSADALNGRIQRLFGRRAQVVNAHPIRYSMLLWEGPDEHRRRADQFVVDAVPARARPINAQLGDGVELLAAEITPTRVGPERQVRVVIYFRATRRVRGEWSVFVHADLPDGDRQHRMLSDHPPADGLLPVSAWPPGRIVRDETELLTGRRQQPGTYAVRAGLFDDDGRMPVRSGPHDEDRVELGTIEVTR